MISILRTGLGVGDVLLATSILEALHRIHQKKFVVETLFPELFYNNPNVRWILRIDRRDELIKKMFGYRAIWRIGNMVNIFFEKHILIKPTYPFPCRGKHLIDAMMCNVGVELLSSERRPFIYLTLKETKTQSWAKGWIAVQSSSSNYWTPNKNWITGRMAFVVKTLKKKGLNIVHLGSKEDEALPGVKDLRGITTLRETAAILSNVRLFIGMEGGLIHMAKGVNTNSVVIYTHYTDPLETGYSDNFNLRYDKLNDSCWNRNECQLCKKSSEAITTRMVLDTVEKTLAISL